MKRYLQAASVKTLVEALYDNWGFSHFHTDGTYLFGSTVGKPREEFDYSGRCFPRSSVGSELLSRFAALEAERDELKAFAVSHEQWEADLIMDNEAWDDDHPYPRIPRRLWKSALDLQAKRNTALGRLQKEATSHDSSSDE